VKNLIVFTVGLIFSIITGYIVMCFYFGLNEMNHSKNIEIVKLSFFINIFLLSFLFLYSFIDKYKWGIVISLVASCLFALYGNYLIESPKHYIIIILPLSLLMNSIIILMAIWKIYKYMIKLKSE